MGMTEAANETIYLRRFLTKLGLNHFAEIVIYKDNMSAKKLTENPVFHERSRNIDIKSHFIRESIKSDEVKVEYLSINEMPADIFTKGLTKPKHLQCDQMLGLEYS
ncbi:hypothetical protein JTB14_030880 [Gonioctena quinquepunctata]|nr:hypothetical protein JTB14_030880 [Gonioctena quinquepunctata]